MPSYSGHLGFLYYFIQKFVTFSKLHYTPTVIYRDWKLLQKVTIVENFLKNQILRWPWQRPWHKWPLTLKHYMSHIFFNNKWICLKFCIQVDGLYTFNLSSDRFLNIQNGRHLNVITKIHVIGHNYNSLNNAWIHLKFKLVIGYINAVI